MNKFHHESIHRGTDYIDRLNKTHIVVCGAGALGSNFVDTITRCGSSNIIVIDKDRIDAHNISTQIWHESEVGSLKAHALKNRVFKTTGADITVHAKELTAANIKTLIRNKEKMLIVDAFDNSESRKIVQNYCLSRLVPCIHAGMFDTYGEVVWNGKYRVPGDPADGDVCDYPLARNLILLTVAILAEEVLDFCLSDKPRMKNWSVTLKDLSIRELKI